MDTSTTIGTLRLEGFVMNASGPRCTTFEELIRIKQSASSAIVTKSSTLHPRSGNPSPRYYEDVLGSINSMGLPNEGYRSYIEYAHLLDKRTKPIIGSISSMDGDESFEIIHKCIESKAFSALEINVSCPNIPGKPQLAYDFDGLEQFLIMLDQISSDIPIGLKLSPYFDMVHFDIVSAILARHRIDFITCVNSIGNGLFIDTATDSVIIKPKNGFGGIGGKYLKPTGLANVRAFYSRFHKLRTSIDIIGVGGIYTGKDAYEYILAGANAVQLGTSFMQQGGDIFNTINTELMDICYTKGYTMVSEAIGALKTI